MFWPQLRILQINFALEPGARARVERVEGLADAERTAVGYVPRHKDIDWRGLDGFAAEKYLSISAIDKSMWKQEIPLHREFFDKLGSRLPPVMKARFEALAGTLG